MTPLTLTEPGEILEAGRVAAARTQLRLGEHVADTLDADGRPTSLTLVRT